MQLRKLLLAASTVVLASACYDTEIVGPAESLSLRKGQAIGASRHIVVFTDAGIPADFAARVKAFGGSLISSIGDGVAIVEIGSSGAAKLARSRDIEAVEPDIQVRLEPVNRVVSDLAGADAVVMSPSNPTTALAYAFGFQWNYRVVRANAAWAVAGNLGDPSVKVAILDTGIDPTHPDLVGRVDPTLSRAFVATERGEDDPPTDQELIDQFFPTAPSYTDLNGHGTHVASTVASNSVVFAGMTTQTTLIAVKVIGQSGSGSFSSILEGVRYAADVGANVINMSLGATFTKAHGGGLHGALDRTVKYASKKGALVVVAAGNSSAPMDAFHPNVYFAPCETKTVVCVSATGPATGNFFNTYAVNAPLPSNVAFDQFAIFSNFGNDVHVAAPGGNYEVLRDVNGKPILDMDGNEQPISGHFIIQPCSKTLLDLTAEVNKTPCAASSTILLGMLGTSQAAPHVSGLAAMLLGGTMRGASAEAIRAAILGSADDKGVPGIDPQYGYGRINAARAVGLP